ncbi:EboA domain-containing protein [Pontibacter cellulosilyticus]|uniref:EboA domain-containing protein n=1 Tax=Pontibacter cellulosilyticus TaxID=1720253 RepID=A0A923SH78_9BACT|nr:EboA domain-containing protein [Pontibacter cellulosilyticus]MBC5991267.1 EboA domain-containing protein [Pontibacter cellulosilyticus]
MSKTKTSPVLYQADIYEASSFLKSLVEKHVTPQAQQWLSEKTAMLSSETAQPKDLYLAFSAAPRFVGKDKLALTAQNLETANTIRTGFNPSHWSVAQAARTILLLSFPHQNPDDFLATIEQLFNTADMGELVALYAALPLLPHPESFKKRAAEGVRTNMGDVFEAVALDNPYAADYMEEDAWNQMVLKTLFVGKPIYRIYGIEKRVNPKLARMLSDYAHERWAAGRTVSPELWRSVGPYLDANLLPDIKKLFEQPNELEQQAAALACSQSQYAPAKELLNEHAALKERVTRGELTWDLIGNRHLALN